MRRNSLLRPPSPIANSPVSQYLLSGHVLCKHLFSAALPRKSPRGVFCQLAERSSSHNGERSLGPFSHFPLQNPRKARRRRYGRCLQSPGQLWAQFLCCRARPDDLLGWKSDRFAPQSVDDLVQIWSSCQTQIMRPRREGGLYEDIQLSNIGRKDSGPGGFWCLLCFVCAEDRAAKTTSHWCWAPRGTWWFHLVQGVREWERDTSGPSSWRTGIFELLSETT